MRRTLVKRGIRKSRKSRKIGGRKRRVSRKRTKRVKCKLKTRRLKGGTQTIWEQIRKFARGAVGYDAPDDGDEVRDAVDSVKEKQLDEGAANIKELGKRLGYTGLNSEQADLAIGALFLDNSKIVSEARAAPHSADFVDKMLSVYNPIKHHG